MHGYEASTAEGYDRPSAQVNREDIAAYLTAKKKEGWVILGLEQAPPHTLNPKPQTPHPNP